MILVPLTAGNLSSAKDVDRRQKDENATAQKFLNARAVPRAKFASFGAEKAQFNGLDQKLYER